MALALADDDYGLDRSDRAQGPARTLEFRRYLWHGIHEGVFPIYNSACDEASTRRQLLGVLIVEP